MKNKKIEIVKKERNELRPGRKTKNNAALWARREEVYKMYSVGIIKSEIARKFDISAQAVNDDLEAIALMTPAKEVKFKCDAHLDKIISICFEKATTPGIAENAKVAYIHEIAEAVGRKARIHGLERENNNFFLSQSITNMGSESNYSKWDKEKLQTEFQRRNLKIKSGEK